MKKILTFLILLIAVPCFAQWGTGWANFSGTTTNPLIEAYYTSLYANTINTDLLKAQTGKRFTLGDGSDTINIGYANFTLFCPSSARLNLTGSQDRDMYITTSGTIGEIYINNAYSSFYTGYSTTPGYLRLGGAAGSDVSADTGKFDNVIPKTANTGQLGTAANAFNRVCADSVFLVDGLLAFKTSGGKMVVLPDTIKGAGAAVLFYNASAPAWQVNGNIQSTPSDGRIVAPRIGLTPYASGARPAAPALGDIICIDGTTTSDSLLVYLGGAWVVLKP